MAKEHRVLACVVSLLVCPAVSWAGDLDVVENCAVLLKPAEVQQFNSVTTTYAYWQSVQHKIQTDAGFKVSIPAALDAGGKFTNQDDYGKQLGISWTNDTRNFLIARYISDSQGEQYNVCARQILQNRKEGVYLGVKSLAGDVLNLTLTVTGATSEQPRSLRIFDPNGKFLNDVSMYVGLIPTERDLTVRWVDPSHNFRLNAYLENQNHLPIGSPASIDLAPVPVETPFHDRHAEGKSNTTCGGKGNDARIPGNPVELHAAQNEVFDLTTLHPVDQQNIPFHVNSLNRDFIPSGNDEGIVYSIATPTYIEAFAWCAYKGIERPSFSISFSVGGATLSPRLASSQTKRN